MGGRWAWRAGRRRARAYSRQSPADRQHHASACSRGQPTGITTRQAWASRSRQWQAGRQGKGTTHLRHRQVGQVAHERQQHQLLAPFLEGDVQRLDLQYRWGLGALDGLVGVWG